MRFRRLLLLFLLLPLAGCKDRRPGTAADSVVSGGAGGATATTASYEAPGLIPGVERMLQLVEQRQGELDEGTTAAYRNQASHLVNAMVDDLYRTGNVSDGSIRAWGDSALILIGGGAGDAPTAKPQDVLKSAAIVRRIIEEYGQRMRDAGA
jgi:hypothetical protein